MNWDAFGGWLVGIIGIPAAVFAAVRGIADLSRTARLRNSLDGYLSIYERAPAGKGRDIVERILLREFEQLQAAAFPSSAELAIIAFRGLFRSLALIYFVVALALGALSAPDVIDILRGETDPPYTGLAANAILTFLFGVVALFVSLLPRAFIAPLLVVVEWLKGRYWRCRYWHAKRRSEKADDRRKTLEKEIAEMQAKLDALPIERQEGPDSEDGSKG